MARMTILCLLTAYLAVSSTTATEPEPAATITTSVEPEPAPEGSTTPAATTPAATTPAATTPAASTTPAAGTTVVGATTTSQQQQTVTQEVVFVDLSSFSDVEALKSSYKTSLSNASNTHASNIAVTIQTIVVTVSATLSTSVDNADLIAAIAKHLNVQVDAVKIQSLRRLFDEDLDERRLASVTKSVDITVPNNTADIVQSAKNIHAAMQNNTGLGTVVSSVANVVVTATTSVTVKVTMQAVIATSGTLNIAAINSAVGSSLGGNATGSVDTGSGGNGGGGGGAATTTASGTGSSQSDLAECPGYIRVALACVLVAVASHLGAL